jgi:DNA polymerase-1
MLKVYGIDSPDFEKVSVAAEIIEELKKVQWTQLDSETYGFDPHQVDLMCLQLGNGENEYVIHPSKVHEFKDFLEKAWLIGHNIKFDLKFLYKYNIWPTKVYDTMLAEQVIHCGIPPEIIRHRLDVVAKRRINVDIDKSVRDTIFKEGLTSRVIQYAADDVKYLEKIKDAQQADLKKWELFDALEIENQFVLALAYTEFCGFQIDPDKWKMKMERDAQGLIESQERINQYILDENIEKFINPQLDMFTEKVSARINWGSPKQVIKLFKILGIPTELEEKGEVKHSVAAKNIEKYATKFPFVKQYLSFKEQQKMVSTYGQNFLDQINKVTGRLHTNFRQILDTSRISSGGKNKETGEEYLNFQNIPRDPDTRACFIAKPGNVLLVSDYSGQEQIVLANFSLDKNLLEFYDKGLADMHAFVASKFPKWKEELEGLTLKQIKELHSDKRQAAKIAGFVINYGGAGSSIADQLGVSVEEGDEVFAGYFEAFPDLKEYFEKQKKEALNLGYVQFNSVTKRKSFVNGYEDFLALRKKLNRVFWDRWKRVKTLPETSPERIRMRDMIKEYFKIKGAIERKSLNYPIQGTSAEITKIACIMFYRWILANGYQMKVLIPNLVHDEIVAECPVEMAEEVSPVLKECMVRAGRIYCKRVPLLAEPEATPFWKK